MMMMMMMLFSQAASLTKNLLVLYGPLGPIIALVVSSSFVDHQIASLSRSDYNPSTVKKIASRTSPNVFEPNQESETYTLNKILMPNYYIDVYQLLTVIYIIPDNKYYSYPI